VKLLDKMMHAQADAPDQQVVVLSQVLASEVNIGYEDILNTQVGREGAQLIVRSEIPVPPAQMQSRIVKVACS
jgi:hypothetical protein